MKGKHILVYRLSALGDVAMTLPAVYSVARTYPQHRFHVVTSAFCAQLYVNAPENITVHGVEKPTGPLGLLRNLCALPIDGVADLHNVPRSWLVDALFLLRVKRVAMLHKQRGERMDILHQRQTASRPFVLRYFDVFARLGLPCQSSFTSLFPVLPPLPLELTKGTERWIGIAPYARYINKVYPLEQMQQVAQLLASNEHTRVFLFGSRGEQADTLRQWEELSPRIRCIAGILPLPQELALMAHLDTMISMDSANMHLASLAGTRVISIWGSTTPACGFLGWGQREEDAVCAHIDCQPCAIGGSKHCGRNNLDCLFSLQPASIIDRCNITL